MLRLVHTSMDHNLICKDETVTVECLIAHITSGDIACPRKVAEGYDVIAHQVSLNLCQFGEVFAIIGY